MVLSNINILYIKGLGSPISTFIIGLIIGRSSIIITLPKVDFNLWNNLWIKLAYKLFPSEKFKSSILGIINKSTSLQINEVFVAYEPYNLIST